LEIALPLEPFPANVSAKGSKDISSIFYGVQLRKQKL
jgi:hypothetical protein